MSDFVQQESTELCFNSSCSWVILSPIEQSIKAKIEKIGTPLKDWDINIYRGVLTGFNDAFIISGEKRKEILAKCKSVDERKRTDDLIRPILRGRDIKRYSYLFISLPRKIGRISSAVFSRSSTVLQFASISSRFAPETINASLKPVFIP